MRLKDSIIGNIPLSRSTMTGDFCWPEKGATAEIFFLRKHGYA